MKTHLGKYFEPMLVFAVLAVTAFFSFHKLTEAPTVWYDEGFYSQAAENLALHGIWGLQVNPGEFVSLSALSAGYPLIAPIALAYKIFGVSVISGRVVMALFILALLIASYFLARRLFGVYVSILSTLLLATFPVLYGNGKSILGEVPAFFFMLITLIFFERVFVGKRATEIILAGVFLGVTLASKVTFLLAALPAFVIAIFFYKDLIFRSLRTYILFLIGVLAPMFVWWITQFGAEDTFLSVVRFYINPYSTDIIHSTIFANVSKFFTEIPPAHLLILTAMWVVAIGIRIFRKEKISFSETVMFIFTIFIYLIFLKSPGWYRYFFPAQLAAILFAPNAFFTITRELWSYFALPQKIFLHIFIVGAILILSLAQAYQTMFNSFVADYYGSTKTLEMENYFARAPRDLSYFIYNVPEVVVFLPSANYYQYTRAHENQVIGKEEINKISQGVPDRVIVYDGAYRKHETDFLSYIPKEIVSKYVILTRAISTENHE